MKTHRLSSNLTLFFKLFIPVFWTVFFGAFTLVVLFYKNEFYGNIPRNAMQIGTVLFFISGIALMIFTLLRLKRVEMSEDGFAYITDYFRHRRYAFQDIEKIEESNFLLLKIVSIYLKASGTFGKRIIFIASGSGYRDFLNAHPELAAAWVDKGRE